MSRMRANQSWPDRFTHARGTTTGAIVVFAVADGNQVLHVEPLSSRFVSDRRAGRALEDTIERLGLEPDERPHRDTEFRGMAAVCNDPQDADGDPRDILVLHFRRGVRANVAIREPFDVFGTYNPPQAIITLHQMGWKRRDFKLVFEVPDAQLDLDSDGRMRWDRADRTRWLDWLGIQPA